MAEYKTDDKAQVEYIEHVNNQDGRIEQSEQSRLDDAELMAGEATEKASPSFGRKVCDDVKSGTDKRALL
jgi:hypothetical protein